MKTDLTQLHDDIDQRVHSIRAERPDWPCSKGCGACCRHLADVPQLTATEWALLREGLAALPAAQLAEIRQEVAALAAGHQRPVVCPMLDRINDACPVYLQRPVACRTYGFYMQRGIGLYCGDIEGRVAAGAMDEVVWGNHDAIEQRLAGLGASRPLTEWFAAWERGREG